MASDQKHFDEFDTEGLAVAPTPYVFLLREIRPGAHAGALPCDCELLSLAAMPQAFGLEAGTVAECHLCGRKWQPILMRQETERNTT